MLRRGDSVPHFEASTLAGAPFSYSTIWQHTNLLLVVMPAFDSESAAAYAADVTARFRELGGQQVACVITRDRVPGISAPAVVIADRWGEVIFAAETPGVADLPAPEQLMEWVTYTTNRCPECEGEAR